MLVCAKNKEEEFSYVNGIWNILLENKLAWCKTSFLSEETIFTVKKLN